jgi:CBS domain-containing protein
VPSVVREIMETDLPAAKVDAPIQDVLKLLRECELPGVPVVDDDDRCVGIITEADLILPDPEGDLHLPHYIELFGGIVFIEPLSHFEERLRKAFAAKAADMMTPDPDTVTPETPVEEAAHRVYNTGHNRLPVVDDDGRLVGVVTRMELLGALTS